MEITRELQERSKKIQDEISNFINYTNDLCKEELKDTRKWYQKFYLPPPQTISYESLFAIAIYVKLAELELKIEETDCDS